MGGWLNRVQHPDTHYTRQQMYLMTAHANKHSSNMIVGNCVLVREALRVLEAGRCGNLERGGNGGGGPRGGEILSRVSKQHLQFSSLLCMVVIRYQAYVFINTGGVLICKTLWGTESGASERGGGYWRGWGRGAG